MSTEGFDRSAARARCDAAAVSSDIGELTVLAMVTLPAALDAIDAVLALHQPEDEPCTCAECGGDIFCRTCDNEPWPCPTAAALGVSE